MHDFGCKCFVFVGGTTRLVLFRFLANPFLVLFEIRDFKSDEATSFGYFNG